MRVIWALNPTTACSTPVRAATKIVRDHIILVSHLKPPPLKFICEIRKAEYRENYATNETVISNQLLMSKKWFHDLDYRIIPSAIAYDGFRKSSWSHLICNILYESINNKVNYVNGKKKMSDITRCRNPWRTWYCTVTQNALAEIQINIILTSYHLLWIFEVKGSNG